MGKIVWVSVFQCRWHSSATGVKMLLKLCGIRAKLKFVKAENPESPIKGYWHVLVASSRVEHARAVVELIRQAKGYKRGDSELSWRVDRWLLNLPSKEERA